MLLGPAKHLEAYFRAEDVTAARAPGPAAEGDVAVAPEADGSGRLQRRPDHARAADQDAVAGLQGARRHQVPPPLLRLGDLVRLAVVLVPLPVLLLFGCLTSFRSDVTYNPKLLPDVLSNNISRLRNLRM